MKKYIAFVLCAGAACAALSGCKIDVNKLAAQNGGQADSSSKIESVSDFYTDEENTDTLTEEEYAPESEAESDAASPSFDTSAYQVYYISGAASVPIYENENGSKQTAILKSGDSVYFISSSVTGYTFVYSEVLGGFGYVDSFFLAPDYSEVTKGETYYVTDNNTPAYSDKYCSEEIFTLNMNDAVTVMAKVTNGYWLICDKSGTYGYVSFYSLSEDKVKKKTESKQEKKTESKADNKTENKTESADESKSEAGSSSLGDERIIGYGDFPQGGYESYSVNAESGYLALRSAKSSDDSNIIGELYYGDVIYVMDTSDYYWYVYSSTLGMYGYVDSGFVAAL